MSDAADRKVKTALDETRLLMLGAQILFGFHLNAAFQQGFAELPVVSRSLHAAAFVAMATAVGLLIAPSLQHRIVEEGHATGRILAATTRLAGWALLFLAIGLGSDLYIVLSYRWGAWTGASIGLGFGALALLFWYGAEWLLKEPAVEEPMKEHDTPLDVRVEQMLTEVRVLLPGAQALFGFQLAVMLTEGFGDLATLSKAAHTVALCCIALAVILLMAPAAFHRIAYGGRNTEGFHRLGSHLVVAAAFPLAAGITLDLFVAVTKALNSPRPGILAAAAAAGVLIFLWFIQPLVLRARRRMRAAARDGKAGTR